MLDTLRQEFMVIWLNNTIAAKTPSQLADERERRRDEKRKRGAEELELMRDANNTVYLW